MNFLVLFTIDFDIFFDESLSSMGSTRTIETSASDVSAILTRATSSDHSSNSADSIYDHRLLTNL